MEPGQTFIHGKVPTVTHSSVCPKISRSSCPVSSFHFSNTSGLSGSPAVVQCWMEERSYLDTSSRIMKR